MAADDPFRQLAGLVDGTAPTFYLPATAVTVVCTAAALAGAIVLGARREL